MSNDYINDVGNIATTLNVLNEASRRNDALAALINSPLPDELKAEIFVDYKRLKRKQMLIVPLITIGWFVVFVLFLVGIDFLFNERSLEDFINSNIFIHLLFGAMAVLPIYFIFKMIFKGDTPWDIYYAWYKKQHGSHFNTESLLRIFGLVEETIEESNMRIAAEMRAAGKSNEQIEAVINARSDYQLKAGLRPETEEEEDDRIRKQMKDNGYTDEQIDKAFGKIS